MNFQLAFDVEDVYFVSIPKGVSYNYIKII